MEQRLGIFAVLAFAAGVVGAQQSNIECVPGEDGSVVASATWRNAIGQGRADEICRNRAPSPSVQAPSSPDLMPAPAPLMNRAVAAPAGVADFKALPGAAVPQPSAPSRLGNFVVGGEPPASAMPSAQEMVPMETWQVRAGDLLSQTLRGWATKAGWVLVWDFPEKEDFRLGVSNAFHADFKSAVYRLVDSLPPGVRIQVNLHQENSPPLIHVMREEGGR